MGVSDDAKADAGRASSSAAPHATPRSRQAPTARLTADDVNLVPPLRERAAAARPPRSSTVKRAVLKTRQAFDWFRPMGETTPFSGLSLKLVSTEAAVNRGAAAPRVPGRGRAARPG